jgi:diguanylate cyclase (GGDEF)-like protein
MLDLDDFKQVNDEFGHQKGDQVLVKLADVIRTTIRAMDIAGRYGGEEFAVILPETDAAAAAESAERLRRAVESAYRQEVQVTASIGVACYPTDGDDVDALVQSADDALYQAKAAGKNRVIAKAEASPDRRRED